METVLCFSAPPNQLHMKPTICQWKLRSPDGVCLDR